MSPSDIDVVHAHELRRLTDELGAAVERADQRKWIGLRDVLLSAQEEAERVLILLQEGQLP